MSATISHYKQRIKHTDLTAKNYLNRKPHKDQAEMNLVRRGFSSLNGVKTVLDAPCGVGRATILLASMGFQTTGMDLGQAAVEVARAEVQNSPYSANLESGDLEQLDYPDNHFDAILCFRMYHHFPDDEIRRRVVAELCRVADKYVLISYFSPFSFTSIKRKLRHKLGKKPSIQHATSLASINEFFEQQGFKLNTDLAQRRYLHTLHLAVYASS